MGASFKTSFPRRDFDVVVVNPLGGALQHYTLRTLQTLEAVGVLAVALSVAEPSAHGGSRLSWLLRYCGALIRARHHRRPGGRILVTWPVLGHLDRLLVSVLTGDKRAAIVMHDPNPLVGAVGYGPGVVRMMELIVPSTTLVVHGTLAQEELIAQRLPSVVVAHPVFESGMVRCEGETPVLRVLGQWKPDRDVDLLAELAGHFPHARLEIIGRGWPPVRGWRVRDEFVSEAELDFLLTTSSAVLIPYQRFYQSGIAARALEAAVPVVGRERELSAMTGPDYPFLVSAPYSVAFWVKATGAALSSDVVVLDRIRRETTARALRSWETWVLQ